MSEHTIANHHNSEPSETAAEVETVETVETALEALASTEAPSLTPVEPNAGITKAASVAASSYQVNITLDAETHEYFRTRAAADDRSLNKFLARELKRYVVASVPIKGDRC